MTDQNTTETNPFAIKDEQFPVLKDGENFRCLVCGNDLYNQSFRLKVKNEVKDGQNVQKLMPAPVLMCINCGWEVGTDPALRKKYIDELKKSISLGNADAAINEPTTEENIVQKEESEVGKNVLNFVKKEE